MHAARERASGSGRAHERENERRRVREQGRARARRASERARASESAREHATAEDRERENVSESLGSWPRAAVVGCTNSGPAAYHTIPAAGSCAFSRPRASSGKTAAAAPIRQTAHSTSRCHPSRPQHARHCAFPGCLFPRSPGRPAWVRYGLLRLSPCACMCYARASMLHGTVLSIRWSSACCRDS
jgi:hypothetical protein